MGWDNPTMNWSDFERTLSGKRRPGGRPAEADGGDSPAWTWNRPPYDPPDDQRPRRPDGPVVPYAELHCHSNFSFLDGASHPEELVEEAIRLGLSALALTDHDGLAGVVRLAEAAEKYDLPTVFGAELSLGLTAPQNGMADPEGSHLLVLAAGLEGYHRLSGAITAAHHLGLKGKQRIAEKGKPVYDLEDLARQADGHWVILTGCRKGAVRQGLSAGGRPDGKELARRELLRLVSLFGAEQVVVELIDHGNPLDGEHNDVLAELAAEHSLATVATNNVHFHRPDRWPLAAAVAAVRARRSLDELDGFLPAGNAAHLRSGAEMAARFARYPGAVTRSVELAQRLAFPLKLAKPRLPQNVWEGKDPMTYLRQLVRLGALARYGTFSEAPAHYARLDRELAVIEEKDFPGYFLIVHDLVKFAKDHDILCQGRGSAANSAVCYVLGITAIDAIYYELPFERFLATTRTEEPDIDVDFDSDRREEVIQYVYEKYGRANAAQVCNVITYRPRSAVRDMAKALGYSSGQQDAWSKQVDHWGALTESADHDIPQRVIDYASQLLTFPRHLGIHSGGMVLTDGPVGRVCPIEWGRMENRSVLQWDKGDCAAMGLVKFDLLGLGMLAAISHTFDLIHTHLHDGPKLTLDRIPKEEPAVYDMLCLADSVGVFQVESRAQMATLPRLRPRTFYQLAIEVALIRPGPIQGGAVHPYIRRKMGTEKVDYLHDKLKPVLERTLGVPLFQEQLMQIAMTVGGCTGDDADQLRRAMGSNRGLVRIGALREKLFAGFARNGITGELADALYARIQAFANFGFAESHAISFASLVYASTWLKLHYPAAFLAALLRAQPMGFYSPQSLVADAARHGVITRRPDLLRSGVHAVLEPLTDGPSSTALSATGMDYCWSNSWPPPQETDRFDPDREFDFAVHRRDGGVAVRLGLAGVRGIGEKLAGEIVSSREGEDGPFASLEDLTHRVELTAAQVEALATAGAFDCFGMPRREALWQAGSAAQLGPWRLPAFDDGGQPPLLPDLQAPEETTADLWATGISVDGNPIRHIRTELDERGIVSASGLRSVEHGTRVQVAGVVTHRQRPATANSITFMNLEDETGMINVVCSVGVWARYRRTAQASAALVIRGLVERSEGVINIVADRFERLPLTIRAMSRDFR